MRKKNHQGKDSVNVKFKFIYDLKLVECQMG